ncbi:hypothetical protein CDAR_275731 [Caerostris darwini]|uniref:Uncharacterized protein n=1 Tax=Caerostris darwini TaxID=1538125 RepID=A0AAV4NKX7_9ARAC|nr:hypothetical protein CDAR_275731 [Caerostris darwini]
MGSRPPTVISKCHSFIVMPLESRLHEVDEGGQMTVALRIRRKVLVLKDRRPYPIYPNPIPGPPKSSVYLGGRCSPGPLMEQNGHRSMEDRLAR